MEERERKKRRGTGERKKEKKKKKERWPMIPLAIWTKESQRIDIKEYIRKKEKRKKEHMEGLRPITVDPPRNDVCPYRWTTKVKERSFL